MGFTPLFQLEGDKTVKPRRASKSGATVANRVEGLGCDYCPLDKVPGVRKILGNVTGKEMAVFAQSPGPDENEEGIELFGRAGQFFWNELKKVGIERKDIDVQNVVRCFPCDVIKTSYDTYLKMRNPTTQEIKCCSLHTQNILPKLKAKRILVLGQVAAKALLETRSIPQNKVFWSDKLKARVYLVDHPAFFIRGYATPERLRLFRETLALFASEGTKSVAELADHFAYIKSQNYHAVTNQTEALVAAKHIRHYARSRRVVVDIEDAPTGGGKRIIIAIGFCAKPGISFVFVVSHWEQHVKDGREVFAVAKELLEDSSIRKVMHYGCSDCAKLKEFAGVTVRGFIGEGGHDTILSEWLRFPDRKKYGLDEVAESRFPEFSGYKRVVVKDIITDMKDLPVRVANASLDAQMKYLEDNELLDYSKLTIETLRLYNGADCDLTKRAEVSNAKEVSAPLLNLYMQLNELLYQMEPNGPLFDYKQQEKLEKVYPVREKKLLARLRKMLGNREYNPGSPLQVYAAIYDHFGLEYPFKKGKPNTRKLALQVLARQHEFPKLQLDWRGVSKAYSTYVVGYKETALTNHDRLRTIWKATGTRTGRLSSSGGKSKKRKGVNLQNIHGDPQIQNMCVADLRWEKLCHAAALIRKKYGAKRAGHVLEVWVRKHMPDLCTFLMLDYGQVEVRVAAQLSGDKNLKKDCTTSDIHTAVGVAMTGWKAEDIAKNKSVRTSTKNVHFGILFGSGDEGTHDFVVARTDVGQTPMTLTEVKKARVRYFQRYSGVRNMIDRQREFALEHDYVETMFGMKQPLYIREDVSDDAGEEIEEDSPSGSSYWANQAVNGPIQGTAHQLLVCALVNLLRKPKRYKVLGVPVMDVHDALFFRVRVFDLIEACRKARYLMEKESLATVASDFPHIKWDVPIVTDAEAGLSLGCKIEITKETDIGTFLLEWATKRSGQLVALDKEVRLAIA